MFDGRKKLLLRLRILAVEIPAQSGGVVRFGPQRVGRRQHGRLPQARIALDQPRQSGGVLGAE